MKKVHTIAHIFRAKRKMILCVAFFCLLLGAAVRAQPDLNQSLVLIRPYEPTVMEAQKISTLPNLKDSFVIKPSFDYSIRPKRIDTHFDVTPISPAKLQHSAQNKLYNGYIKAGLGTLPNVLGEISINTLRNKNYSAGALFRIDGAYRDIKLNNSDKNKYDGYNDISGKVFGQKFLYSAILYGDLGASGQTVYNYGYDTTIDTAFTKNMVQKSYFFADANVGIRSSHFKTQKLNYDAQLGYKYAGLDKYNEKEQRYSENAVSLKGQVDNNMFGGNLKLDLYNRAAFDSLRNNYAAEFNPWFMLENDSIRMLIGLRLGMFKEGDRDAVLNAFPKIEVQFTLLKDFFIPFIGVDGRYMNLNTWRCIVTENPFIRPEMTVPASKTELLIYAGLKGNITSKLAYYFRVDFSNSQNDYLFVNDTTSLSVSSCIQNHFTVVNDDMTSLSFKGEIYFNPIEKLNLGIKGIFNNYNPSVEKYAWHRPKYTVDFSAKYNLHNKIIANLDLICIGKRYVKSFDIDEFRTLDGVVSVNLGGEYRYKTITFFAKLNNITAARYYRWNYYQSYRFNAMVGFTYSL